MKFLKLFNTVSNVNDFGIANDTSLSIIYLREPCDNTHIFKEPKKHFFVPRQIGNEKTKIMSRPKTVIRSELKNKNL